MSDRPPVPGAIGSLFERLYRLELARRNRRFDAGVGVTTLDRPVISVGNISVGGTGKTPMVMRLVRTIVDSGRTPCIAMRGYKSTDGKSDEAESYRRAFESVPVVAQPDRTAGLKELFATDAGRAIDCVVLDDGFQHRKLARDLDIVLIDASRDPFEEAPTGRCLPAGWLREPVESLSRGHAVVLTHAEQVNEPELIKLVANVSRAHGAAPVAVTEHAWAALEISEPGSQSEQPPEWLSGRSAVGVCAIGSPAAFMGELRRRCSGRLLAELSLRDHDPYSDATVERIIEMARGSRAEAIVFTDKDWSKLSRIDPGRWPCPVVRPRLELRFRTGGDELSEMVLAACGGRPA